MKSNILMTQLPKLKLRKKLKDFLSLTSCYVDNDLLLLKFYLQSVHLLHTNSARNISLKLKEKSSGSHFGHGHIIYF